MIKIFNNKTLVPSVTLQSKTLRNNVISSPDETGLIKDVKSNTIMFVKVAVNGLTGKESLGKLSLLLKYKGLSKNCILKVYKCPNIALVESNMQSYAAKINDEETIAYEAKVIEKTNGDEEKVAILDLTNIAKSTNVKNSIITIAIVNNNETNGFDIYDVNKLSTQADGICINATMSDFSGISSMYKYDKHEVANTKTGYVNLYNGTFIHVFPHLTSLSNKMPITYQTMYNVNKLCDKSFLSNGLIESFQYRINKSGNEYYIEDATGIKKYYSFIDKTSDRGKQLIKVYNIKHVDDSEDALYFCDEDYSYFYLNKSEVLETVTLYDKQENKTIFEIALNESGTSFGRFTKIKEIANKFGEKITYTWTNGKLEKINNSDKEEVLFTYNSNNKITKVDFTKQKQYVEYTYNMAQYITNIAVYSYATSPATKIEEVQLNYQDILVSGVTMVPYLNSIVDTISKFSIVYDFNGNVVKGVAYKNKENKIYYNVTYLQEPNRTIVSTSNKEKTYYYFDNYGRCKLEIDNYGRSITYNYNELENGMSNNINSISSLQTNSRNLLENHSFEQEETLFAANSLGWKINGKVNSIVKIIKDGVYGEKCLFIDKANNETITIYQDVVNPNNKDVTLTGFVKCFASNENETIGSETIKVKISGTYTVDEDVIVDVDSATTTTENKPVTHYYSKEQTDFNTSLSWKEFKLNSSIPSTAYNITMKVELIISGIACKVYFDDLQLAEQTRKTRYNLIENGYLEFAENDRPKGWYFYNCDNDDKLIDVLDDDAHSSIFGKKVMKFHASNVSSNQDKLITKKMYKEIDLKGLAGEQLVFSVFAKVFTSDNLICRSFIKIIYTNGANKEYFFDFDKNFNNWQMLTRSISVEDDYKKVVVGVEYAGGNEALFDAFQLYKDSYGKYYNYNKVGNITEIINADGNSVKINYDSDNQIKEVISADGSTFKYEYDTSGRLSKVKDIYGNIVSLEYTNNYVTKTTINTINGETITYRQTKDIYGNTTQLIDENGKITLTSYNQLNQITQITNPNELVERYRYNADTSLQYFESVLLEAKGAHRNSFTYDDEKKLKSVSSNNQTKYNFTYDSYNRLVKIDVNGSTINNLFYTGSNSKELISKKQYGESGDYFEFTYNKDDLVDTVKLNGVDIAKYEYDESGNISQIYDIANNEKKYYTYDLKGKLIRVTDSTRNTISYVYDNLDNVQQAIYKINDIIKSYDYQYEYETNDYEKTGYINKLERVFNEEVIKGGFGGVGLSGATFTKKQINEEYDPSIKMDVINFSKANEFICYDYSTFNSNKTNYNYFNLKEWQEELKTNKTACMLVNVSGTLCDRTLYTFLSKGEKLCSFVLTSNGTLKYVSGIYSIETREKIKLNAWNLIGIHMYYDEDEEYYKCTLSINGIPKNDFIGIDVSLIDSVIVGNDTSSPTSNSVFSCTLKVSLMTFGAHYYHDGDFKAVYNEGLDYLNSTNNILKASGVSYYNQEVYKDFDVITLNGSLNSKNGITPLSLASKNHSFRFDKARIFEYDTVLQRHVYGVFSSRSDFIDKKALLSYNLNMTNKGAFSISFKIKDATNSNRTLIAFGNSGQEKIKIFIDQSKYLQAYVNNTLMNFKKEIDLNTWYTLTVFIIGNGIYFFINGSLFYNYFFVNGVDLSNTITYVASSSTGSNVLDGYVEMLAFSTKQFDVSSHSNVASDLYNNGKVISIKNNLDSLGRVIRKEVITNKKTLDHLYEYNKFRINREIFFDNHNYKYEYDDMGNITKKDYYDKDTLLNETSYQYDQLGRLISETYSNGKKHTYTYDTNGNIKYHTIYQNNTIISNLNYTYSTTIKDLLLSITDSITNTVVKQFEYNNSYKGIPTSITSSNVKDNLIWEGRRLRQVGTKVRYTYNEDGIRVMKQGGSYMDKFVLEGNTIVALIHEAAIEENEYAMYFNYDEQGNLVGLNCEGKEYFYVRDILGNIVKIIDEDNVCVVEYEYDAWGNFTKNIRISCTVSKYNPFVYKGYYYDSEVNLYYLNSRYYDPSIGRFISTDDISYLSPDNLKGLNLFAYCENNPIMYKDPSGAFLITSLIIGATIGALAGFCAAMYIDYKDDGQIFNGSVEWYKYVGLITLGGVTGALLGAAGPLISSVAGSSFTIGASEVVLSTGELALTTGVTVSGVQVIEAIGAVVSTVGATYMFTKTSKKSKKATSSDKPSWVNEGMVNQNKTAQQNAKDILDQKYGRGNWRKGPKEEYNRIIKWIERYVRYYRGW